MAKFDVTYRCEAEKDGVLIPLEVNDVIEASTKEEAIYKFGEVMLKTYDKLLRVKVTVKELK